VIFNDTKEGTVFLPKSKAFTKSRGDPTHHERLAQTFSMGPARKKREVLKRS